MFDADLTRTLAASCVRLVPFIHSTGIAFASQAATDANTVDGWIKELRVFDGDSKSQLVLMHTALRKGS